MESLHVVILHLNEVDAGYDSQIMTILARIEGVEFVTEAYQSILALKLEGNYEWSDIEDDVIDAIQVSPPFYVIDVTPSHGVPL